MIFTVDGSEDDDNEVESKGDENTDNLPFGRSIEINSLILRLNKEFHDDVGIFSAFLFDCFRLKPNEGTFSKANLQHAYLSGDCFECMACSDIVVRAVLFQISQNKRLVSYCLFGLVSDSDIGGAIFVTEPHLLKCCCF